MADKEWEDMKHTDTMKVNKKDITVTILVEIDGQIHLASMKKDKFVVIDEMVKGALDTVYPTGVSQAQLNRLLGYKG